MLMIYYVNIIQKLYLGDNELIIDEFKDICIEQHGRLPYENEFVCLKYNSRSIDNQHLQSLQ